MGNEESITLYSRKGEALAGRREGGHIDKEYQLIEDTLGEDGTRTIILKPKDMMEFKAKIDKLVDLLLEKMGEPKTGQFAKLLKDTLRDYRENNIDKLIAKVEKGEKVSTSDRCFHVIVGDGRRKGADLITIRD